MKERISDHISYKEATKSQTATRKEIDNSPNSDQLAAMKNVAEKCFEPLRNWYGRALGISSFLRVLLLNIAIGGSKTSQHVTGEAIDIDADIFNNGITNLQIFEYLRKRVQFDQLIMEYPDETGEPRWVHISNKLDGNNRGEILIAEKVNGRTVYRHYA
jgi:hypothetical protein